MFNTVIQINNNNTHSMRIVAIYSLRIFISYSKKCTFSICVWMDLGNMLVLNEPITVWCLTSKLLANVGSTILTGTYFPINTLC